MTRSKKPAAKRETPASRRGAAQRMAAKEKIFFRELAMVCNVAAALKTAGLVRECRNIYDRRKRDPAFRAEWEEAIGESYAMLELEMLERGRFGDNRPPPANETEARQRAIPTSTGLWLLRMHRSQAKAKVAHGQRPMRGGKLRDELESRLAEISRRLGGAG